MWNRHSRGEIQLPNVLFIFGLVILQSLLLSYVILKHILSEGDCLQFSYSSVYPIYYSMEAGRHRRFQSTKAPYYAIIKVDRTWWWITMGSTIVFNKQLSLHFHLDTMSNNI
jgi:hypothetical protein